MEQKVLLKTGADQSLHNFQNEANRCKPRQARAIVAIEKASEMIHSLGLEEFKAEWLLFIQCRMEPFVQREVNRKIHFRT